MLYHGQCNKAVNDELGWMGKEAIVVQFKVRLQPWHFPRLRKTAKEVRRDNLCPRRNSSTSARRGNFLGSIIPINIHYWFINYEKHDSLLVINLTLLNSGLFLSPVRFILIHSDGLRPCTAGVRLLAWAKDRPPLHSAQTGSETHPASYPTDNGGSFPVGQGRWSYTSTPPNAFMVWCFIN
jgi:hypothetical protein